jgi:hypothetical protein
MATLSDLVAALSAGTGLPSATVFAYGRFAREAGYISQKGHGRSAATMTAADAANLLIAVGATGTTREAGEAISKYRGLRGSVLKPLDRTGKKVIKWLEPLGYKSDGTYLHLKCSFGDFVQFMIERSIGPDLNKLLRTIPVLDDTSHNTKLQLKHTNFTTDMLIDAGASVACPDRDPLLYDVGIEFQFNRSGTYVIVKFYRLNLGDEDFLTLIFDEPDASTDSDENFGDLVISATLSEVSVAALGGCLSGRLFDGQASRHLRSSLFPPIGIST